MISESVNICQYQGARPDMYTLVNICQDQETRMNICQDQETHVDIYTRTRLSFVKVYETNIFQDLI